MSSAVTSITDAGFTASTSLADGDGPWADDSVAVAVGGGAADLCLELVVGIIIGVTPSSSSSNTELTCVTSTTH